MRGCVCWRPWVAPPWPGVTSGSSTCPRELTPTCGPGLSYMLETLPLAETFQLVMMGDGNCAETVWTFMGLSIPEQTLALFVVQAGIALFQLLRSRPETTPTETA